MTSNIRVTERDNKVKPYYIGKLSQNLNPTWKFEGKCENSQWH